MNGRRIDAANSLIQALLLHALKHLCLLDLLHWAFCGWLASTISIEQVLPSDGSANPQALLIQCPNTTFFFSVSFSWRQHQLRKVSGSPLFLTWEGNHFFLWWLSNVFNFHLENRHRLQLIHSQKQSSSTCSFALWSLLSKKVWEKKDAGKFFLM